MVDSVINEQQKTGFLGLLKELVVHPSITAALPSKPSKREAYKLLKENEAVSKENDDDVFLDSLSKSERLAPTVESRPSTGITSRVSLKSIFSGAVLATYNPHGYDVSTNTVVSTDGANAGPDDALGAPTFTHVHSYDGKLNVGHTILTFLGLQTRFKTFEPTSMSAVTNEWTPKMGGWQLLKNYFGGWYPLFDKNWKWIGGERGVWQLIALPVKLVMFPLKIVATVLTFALNLVKIVTELLPELILNGTGLAINYLTDAMSKNWDNESLSTGRKLGALILGGLATFLLAIPHYVSRVWLVLGKALTSPEQNIRMAYNFFGKRLEIEGKPNLTKALGIVFGALAAALAMSLTIALWAVALPFAIGALVKMVPQFMVAVNWLASSALIAPAMGYVNGALTVVSGFLSIFNPAVAALSAFVGVTVTPTILAVGATIAALAGFITPIASRIADEFSNWWAQRGKDSGPVHFITNLFTFKSKKADLPDPALESEDTLKLEATRTSFNELVRSGNIEGAIDLAIAAKAERHFLVANADGSGWERRINLEMLKAIMSNRPDADKLEPSKDVLRRAVVQAIAIDMANKDTANTEALAIIAELDRAHPDRLSEFFTLDADRRPNGLQPDVLKDAQTMAADITPGSRK